MATVPPDTPSQASALPAHPDRDTAENAVCTLIRWAGNDPTREGLLDTPASIVRACEEFFASYLENPMQIRSRTFSEVDGYDEMIVVTDIRFESHCEHHMVPIIGKAHVTYLYGCAQKFQLACSVARAETNDSSRRTPCW